MEKVKKSLVKKEYLVPFVLVTSLFLLAVAGMGKQILHPVLMHRGQQVRVLPVQAAMMRPVRQKIPL